MLAAMNLVKTYMQGTDELGKPAGTPAKTVPDGPSFFERHHDRLVTLGFDVAGGVITGIVSGVIWFYLWRTVFAGTSPRPYPPTWHH